VKLTVDGVVGTVVQARVWAVGDGTSASVADIVALWNGDTVFTVLVGAKLNDAAPVEPVVALVVERVPEPWVTARVIGTPGSSEASCTVVVTAAEPATKAVVTIPPDSSGAVKEMEPGV